MRLLVPVLAVALTVTAPAVAIAAQADPASVADRSKALAKLFDEYWQYALKTGPEGATFLGDPRYNDAWSDYSAAAFNARAA